MCAVAAKGGRSEATSLTVTVLRTWRGELRGQRPTRSSPAAGARPQPRRRRSHRRQTRSHGGRWGRDACWAEERWRLGEGVRYVRQAAVVCPQRITLPISAEFWCAETKPTDPSG